MFFNADTESIPGTPVTPVQPPDTLYVKLHIGDPGADALDNPAVNTLRLAISVTQPQTNVALDGRAQAVTDLEVIWTGVPADETYSHVSFWDTVTLGNAWYKGPMVAPVPVLTGGNFVFPTGQTFNHA